MRIGRERATMAIDLHLSRPNDYLHAMVRGSLDLDASWEIVQHIATIAQLSGACPILLDVRDVTCALTHTDIFRLAEDMGRYREALRHRIAIVHRQTTYCHLADFLELCTTNRGFQVRLFAESDTAASWLVGETETNRC